MKKLTLIIILLFQITNLFCQSDTLEDIFKQFIKTLVISQDSSDGIYSSFDSLKINNYSPLHQFKDASYSRIECSYIENLLCDLNKIPLKIPLEKENFIQVSLKSFSKEVGSKNVTHHLEGDSVWFKIKHPKETYIAIKSKYPLLVFEERLIPGWGFVFMKKGMTLETVIPLQIINKFK